MYRYRLECQTISLNHIDNIVLTVLHSYHSDNLNSINCTIERYKLMSLTSGLIILGNSFCRSWNICPAEPEQTKTKNCYNAFRTIPRSQRLYTGKTTPELSLNKTGKLVFSVNHPMHFLSKSSSLEVKQVSRSIHGSVPLCSESDSILKGAKELNPFWWDFRDQEPSFVSFSGLIIGWAIQALHAW